MTKRKKQTLAVVVDTKKRLAIPKRWLLPGLAVVAVLAIAGVAVWYFVDGRSDDSAKKPSPMTADYKKQLSDGYASGNYGQVVGALKAQDASSLEARLQLAVAYSNNKQYAESLAVFDELSKADDLNSAYAETAAQVAENTGDMAKAISYYNLAKQKVTKEKLVTAESRIEYYDQRIKVLGGQ